MMSDPDKSSPTLPSTDESATTLNKEKMELFSELKQLETESDEIRIGIAKKLVILCLEDSGNDKGIGTMLMEGRILPILGNQLSLNLPVEVRVGFQVLFDAVLAVISKNERLSLSKHFPTLLALSQNSNSRIAEPVIATIGLITHRLSTSAEVELFLLSGILESLVSSLRTHPDATVRKAIVVALGEIGVGLKLAVVRDEAEKLSKPNESPASATPKAKSEELSSFSEAVSSVSLNGREADALLGAGWEKEDGGETDFANRCRRGVGIIREGLIEVIRGRRKNQREDEKERKEGKEEEEEWREEDDVSVKRVAGSVCGVVFGEVFGVSASWCVEGGVVGVRGSDIEAIRVEMVKKMEEQQATFEARLTQSESEAKKREEEFRALEDKQRNQMKQEWEKKVESEARKRDEEIRMREGEMKKMKDEMAKREEMMTKKLEEQKRTLETRLKQTASEAREREEELKKEKDEMKKRMKDDMKEREEEVKREKEEMKQEKIEMKNRKKEMKKEKDEMEKKEKEMMALIAELRKNQRPTLVTITEIKAVLSNTSYLPRTGDKFRITSGGTSTVTLDHPLDKGIWRLVLRIIQRSSCFHIGFIDSTEGPFPDGNNIGQCNTSLGFCPSCGTMYKCRKGQSSTSHGSVSFKTGDKVVLEVDMEAHMCHLFVNSVQIKVYVRGIPASIKLAITLSGSSEHFEVVSFREVEHTKSHKLPDGIPVEF
ncbi:hypothetical protein BLNAU_14931 [Blattamonas nauphoetae]|uniref:Uncharacterized protein n=1 Tax=Blattamonas nauphoetae TaxID=2049346 RepID=A0ABQ9XFD2_9EUKA|nr:hypothetical protein BLNAU_14931 [Blattamonas nauphoetae]